MKRLNKCLVHTYLYCILCPTLTTQANTAQTQALLRAVSTVSSRGHAPVIQSACTASPAACSNRTARPTSAALPANIRQTAVLRVGQHENLLTGWTRLWPARLNIQIPRGMRPGRRSCTHDDALVCADRRRDGHGIVPRAAGQRGAPVVRRRGWEALRSCRAEAEDDARADGVREADGDDDEEEGEDDDEGDDGNAGITMHMSGGGMCQARDNADRARNKRVATAAVLAIAPQSLGSENVSRVSRLCFALAILRWCHRRGTYRSAVASCLFLVQLGAVSEGW
jgi:hypothetical protein